MTAKVILLPAAWADIREIAGFIGADSPSAADRFLLAVDQTTALLARNPGIGRRCGLRRRGQRSVRAWSVTGFPNHFVFFLPKRGGIHVVRVLHGARDIDALFEE